MLFFYNFKKKKFYVKKQAFLLTFEEGLIGQIIITFFI